MGRKMPVNFHRYARLVGTRIYRSQNSDLRVPSQGVHWTRDPEAAKRFSSPAPLADLDNDERLRRRAARTGEHWPNPVGYHIVEGVLDNPREQIQPPHTQLDHDFRYDQYKGPGIFRNGSLSSEKEIRLRPGATLRVLNISQFTHEGEVFDWPDAPSEVVIEHKGTQRYYPRPEHGSLVRSPSKGFGTRKTTVKRPNDTK